ncbi:MAG: adenylyl cyclase, partial [Streptosporangiaceae bacterium]
DRVLAAPATLPGQPDFGPNVYVFSPSMPQSQIQATVDSIASQQVGNQFGTQRYALLFEPGTYGSAADPLIFQVGFYTAVAGLGASPGDVVINGAVDVYNQCSSGSCTALDNFWRSLSNLTINVTAPPNVSPVPCPDGTEFWATSQASPMRRVDINGTLTLFDYCTSPSYSSGGFIADSVLHGGSVINGSQQQFIVRNSNIDDWTNSVWNQVFSGDIGAPAQSFGVTPGTQYTTLPTSPVTEEEPFLYTDSRGSYHVFVPAVRHNSSGPAWASGTEAGRSIPISTFFVASPSTPTPAINAALARGRNLILTPGVYDLDQPIVVSRPDTVVMGLGFATLVPQHGNAAMIVAANTGVKLSGLIVDAGPVNSPVLLSVGVPGLGAGTAANPDTIQDVFFRIGGAETTPVSATVSLLDNADNSIIDDVWAWRADHGNDVGWTLNKGDTGLVVTGNDVTAYGLAVEHYQKNEVIWGGQGGTDIFFQNELPYDPPAQSDWMKSPSQDGYPAFLVTPNVRTFQGYGMGSYVVFIDTTATLYDAEAFESPDAPGVHFHDIFGVWIAGSGGDDSIINGVGGPVTSTNPGTVEPVDVTSYP